MSRQAQAREKNSMSANDTVKEFITCECGSPGHIAILEMFEWKNNGKLVDVDVSMHINFNPDQSILKRLWHAIKYVFCHKNQNDGFGDIVLNDVNIDKIISFLSNVKTIKENLKKNV